MTREHAIHPLAFLPRLKRWALVRVPEAIGDPATTDALVRDMFLRTSHAAFGDFRAAVLNPIRDYVCGRSHAGDDDALSRYERALASLREEDQQLVVAFVELRLSDDEASRRSSKRRR